MPTPLGWAGGAVINDTIFVFGDRGVSGDVTAVEKYCPLRDLWLSESSVPNPRSRFMTAALNNKIYLIFQWAIQKYFKSMMLLR